MKTNACAVLAFTCMNVDAINALARWQSSQCVHAPDAGAEASCCAAWQGMGSDSSMVFAALAWIGAGVCNGMTAAIAPDKGSHAIIQRASQVRRVFIVMLTMLPR